MSAALCALTALVPSAAHGASLTPYGCWQNTGGAACANTPGLDDAEGIAISPDGANVYVAGTTSNAIDVFNRNSDGSLTAAGCIENKGGSLGCGASAPGIEGPRGLIVSGDGKQVYMSGHQASPPADIVMTFNRAVDGSLSDGKSCTRGADGGTGQGCDSTTFNNPEGLALTPNGSFLYVASSKAGNDGITKFIRGGDGHLTFDGTFSSNKLFSPFRVAVSPDGNTLYTVGTTSNTVVWAPIKTSSDPGDIDFTNGDCYIDDPGGGSCTAGNHTEGLKGAQSVAVSPDGKNVYVVSTVDDTLLTFNVGSGGALKPAQCLEDPSSSATCTDKAPGLADAGDVAVSPDGHDVYVVGKGPSDTVAAFARAADGTLTALGCVHDGVATANCPATAPALSNPQWLAVGPDSREVYVSGRASDSIAWMTLDGRPSCSDSAASTPHGTPVTVALACTDPEGEAIARSVVGGPAHGTVTDFDQAAGTAVYTPAPGFSGDDMFTFAGSDGTLASGAATVTVSVGAAPPPKARAALSALAVVPRRFRIGSLLPRLTRRTPVGTTIRFRLDRAASVRFTFQRASAGRRVGRTCRKPTRANRRRPRCTRHPTAGVLVRTAHAGLNRLRFQGRLRRGRAMRPGSYRLIAQPSTADAGAGVARRATFTLLARLRVR